MARTRAYLQTLALQVAENCSNRDHTQVVLAALRVASGNPSELLAPVDHLLHLGPQRVALLVERPAPFLVSLAWDGAPHVMLTTPAPNAPIAVGFVANNPSWTQPWSPPSLVLNRATFHQWLEGKTFVAMSGLEYKRNRLA